MNHAELPTVGMHALGSIPQVQKGQQLDAGGGETDSRDKDNEQGYRDQTTSGNIPAST
jgi:hypothetical protein